MSPTPRAQRILPRIEVLTRDGVKLCTDIFLNALDAPAPAVVIRTPYGRNIPTLLRMASRLNQEGLCVLLQDCRGRYQSQGMYDWAREVDDTLDTLRWVVEQPWSDGRIGLTGMSVTTNPNCFVAHRPPDGVTIAAMVSIMGSFSHYRTVYHAGALTLHWALPWSVMMDPKQMGRTTWQKLPWADIFPRLPLQDATSGYIDTPVYWSQMLASPIHDASWQRFDASPLLPSLNVPTLHLSGWNDFMLDQSLDGFIAMASTNPPGRQRLIVGPWDHGSLFESFGSQKAAAQRADAARTDLLEVIVEWFKRWLVSPAPEALADVEPPVVLYLLEDGGWLETATYPLPESELVDWYLTSGGRAGASPDDGALVRYRPTDLKCDSFVYDPESPVPTVGGALWPFAQGGLTAGPLDQSEVEQRADVLVYTSAPLETDMCAVGQITVEIWVATSARDTDITAKLVDVDLLGVPRIVQDGIVRGRFHSSTSAPEFLEPHRPYRFIISLAATARRFKKGHRIRLEVSSSNFPKYDRNLNTATWLPHTSASMVAHQMIFHGGAMASRLRVSVVAHLRRNHFSA